MKTTVKILIIICLIIIITFHTHADGTHPQGIKLDGTLGNVGKLDLPGPDYEIRSEYGNQAGSNLFHSFHQFSIHSNESATFTGPNSVSNIISRVTGGNASWIDGRLASAIPGADLYLLNPAGLMFGKNATLDISGSFHVSTADYLRLGENEQFYSMPHANDVLSVSAPSAFGFLDNEVSTVTFEGGEIAAPYHEDQAGLRVSKGKTLSVISGNIEINGISYQKQKTDENGNLIFETATDENGEPVPDDEGNPVFVTDESGDPIPVMETLNPPNLSAPGGRISIAGVASPGEVVPSESDLKVVPVGRMGDISLSGKAGIDTSGDGGGSIFIRGGKFLADDSIIHAKTLGDKDGGLVEIHGDTVSLANGSQVVGNTRGSGKASDITIRANESVTVSGENSSARTSLVSSESGIRGKLTGDDLGDSGKTLIRAKNILFRDGASVTGRTYGGGNGGDITLDALESVCFSGENSKFSRSMITAATFRTRQGAGSGGNIFIRARDIDFNDGAFAGLYTWGSGEGGNVTLKADALVSFDGEAEKGAGTMIHIGTGSKTEGAGDAGKLLIEAENISFTRGAGIDTRARGRGRGGDVMLKARSTVCFDGEKSDGQSSKILTRSTYKEDGAGDAGIIEIEADKIIFRNGGWIDSRTFGRGKGGDVFLKASDSISFDGERSDGWGSTIEAAAYYVEEGGGDAGNLLIEADSISFTRGAAIHTTAWGRGEGGDVTLKASGPVIFDGEKSDGWASMIQTTSSLGKEYAGNAGDVRIEADSISFGNGAYIISSTGGKGKGGDVTLKTVGPISFSGERNNGAASFIRTGTYFSGKEGGDAGNLNVEAGSISFSKGASVHSETAGGGKGGDVSLKVAGQVSFDGEKSDGQASMIRSGSISEKEGAGNAGNVRIEAGSISFGGGACIASGTEGKGNGGDVILKAAGPVIFSGERTNRGKSSIRTDTLCKEKKAGDAGEVQIEADSISFTRGAYINSSTQGSGKAGNIRIHAHQNITLADTDTKGNGSHVYAGSEGKGENVGNGGRIDVSAQTISLSDNASIYTSTSGRGKAGTVSVRAGKVLMKTGASVFSGSELLNKSDHPDIPGRDSQTLFQGDVVKVSDSGDGRARSFVNAGYLRDFASLYQVSDLEELSQIKNLHRVLRGDVAEVADTGNGSPARYICAGNGKSSWIRFDINTDNVLENMEALEKISERRFSSPSNEKPPFASGDVIRVTDAGNGKPGLFVYSLSGNYAVAVRLSRFDAPDVPGLNEISARNYLENGDVARVADPGEGKTSDFVFLDGKWIKFNNTRTAANMEQAETFIARTGSVATVADDGHGNPGTFVSSGKEWLALKNEHVVANMAERDALTAQTGDVAYVADTDGNDNPGNFLYSKGEWLEFDKGDGNNITVDADTLTMTGKSTISTSSAGHGRAGDILLTLRNLETGTGASVRSESGSEKFGGPAGTITVNARDSVSLRGNARLTTEADDAGGGRVLINAENRIHLHNGEITSSVRQGAGKGGDVETRSEFVILDHSSIAANSDQGDGGAVFIMAENFLKSSDSRVTATSNRGNEGTVKIEAPDTDVSSGLAILPSGFTDAARWMKTPCRERAGEDTSRFVMTGRKGIPFAFDDWIPGQLPVVTHRLSENNQPARDDLILAIRNGDFASLAQLMEKDEPLLWEGLALSLAYSSLGHYQKALDILETLAPLAEKEDDLSGTAMFHNCLGDLHLTLGNIRPAIVNLKKGLKKARLSGDSLVIASLLNNLGNLRAGTRNFRGAKKAYKESLDLMKDKDQAGSLKSKVMINMARAEFEMGKIPEAAAIAGHLPEQIISRPDTFDKASDLICFSLLGWKIRIKAPGKIQISEPWLNQAARIGEKTENHRLASWAYGYLGQYYEERMKYQKALEQTRKAVFFARQGYYPEILYRWEWQMGRISRVQGNMEYAVRSFQKAADILNPIRLEFFHGHRRQENLFERDVRPVYLGLAELLLEQENKDRNPDHLYKARDAMDMLKKAELENFFHDECLAVPGKKNGARERRIPPGTAVIYPVPLQDHLSLLIIFPDSIIQARVRVSADLLGRTAKEFRKQLEAGDEDFRDNAARLYDWLIKPAEKEFVSRNTDTLIIAPDGPLRLVPLSALFSHGHFLVEKYALGTVPAISLAHIGQTRQTQSQILLNGLSEPRQGFLGLENVRKELSAISTVMNSKTLLDQEFTVSNLKDEMTVRDYDMVHIATHTVFGSRPEEMFLLTYDGRLTMDTLDRLVGMKKYQDRQLELLSLSACETAVGDERAAFGLAGTALRAGAKSALATLWKTDDKAAFLIVDEFYSQIGKTGTSKAKALQIAQKKLITHDQLNHPIYWAPFLLIGNWL